MKNKIIALASMALIAGTGITYAFANNSSSDKACCASNASCCTDLCEDNCTCDETCEMDGCECGCTCCE